MGSSYRFELKLAAGLHSADSPVRQHDVGQLVLRSVDLFEGNSLELSPGAWSKVLQRLSAKAGFEVSGFRYEGEAVVAPRVEQPARRRRVPAPQEQYEIVYVHSSALFDECLQHIESNSDHERGARDRAQMSVIELALVPRYELVVYEGSTDDDIGSIHLDPILATWESTKAELKRLTGKEGAFKYEKTSEANNGKAVSCTVANAKQFQDCLRYIYMFEKDFKLEVDTVPYAASVSVLPRGDAVFRAGRGDAETWTSVVEMYLDCSYTRDASFTSDGQEESETTAVVSAGKVSFTSPDGWRAVLSRLNHLDRLPENQAVHAFTYQKDPLSDIRTVEGEETWEACKTMMMTEISFLGKLAVTLKLKLKEASDDDSEIGSAIAEAGEGHEDGQQGRDVRRDPLQNLTMLVYDSDGDPVKMSVRVGIPWKELASRLTSMYGEVVTLCYSTDTTTVKSISSESDLRECVDTVQKMWVLGASSGVLHCAVVSSDLAKGLLTAQKKDGRASKRNSEENTSLPQGDKEAEVESRGLTNMHLAASRGEHERLLSMLTGENLKPGDWVIGVEGRDKEGATPLFYASTAGSQRACEVLLANNASIHALDDYGCSALHSAKGQAVPLLITSGARLNLPDNEGWTPLHRAGALDDSEEAKLLIDAFADIEATCKMGWTPLHVAARYQSTKVVDLLIDAGAEVLSKTTEGHSAFELAGAGPSPRHASAHKDAVSVANARKRSEMSREEGKSVSGLISSLLNMFNDRDGEFYKTGQTMYDVFNKYDTDEDGVLTKAEFHEALAARPFSLKFADRERLHRYIDVDGDQNLDIEEFATALLGRTPPSHDKDVIRVDSIDVHLPIRMISSIQAVCVSIDFLGQHRDGKYSKTSMVQMGSRSLPITEGRIPVKHQQRLHINDDKSKPDRVANRREMIEALDGSDDNLRIEVILYSETYGEGKDAQVKFTELGSGVATMVPSEIERNDPTERLRLPVHTKINTAAELPSKWREASSLELQVLFTRVPQSVQARATIREGFSSVQAPQIIDVLSDWEKRSTESLLRSQRKAPVKKASMEPLAEVHIEVRALQALDGLVVEAAKKKGFESLSDKWRQRWKASAIRE